MEQPPQGMSFLQRKGRAIRTLCIIALILAAYAYLGPQLLFINTKNMEPSLLRGNYAFYWQFNTLVYEPKRWDVVRFKTQIGTYSFGRIVGLPGEELHLSKNGTYLNGEYLMLPETLNAKGVKYLPPQVQLNDTSTEFATYNIPANEYFILGDNSERSFDSRYFGGIPEDKIIADIQTITWLSQRN
ncbi:signal peptidase I [Aliamphritea spongicola]|uniref:signal peptidase I n=1 Tax=Aliamphritea spongicola TaxID=707589 RepID=UPI00196B74CE|nr:signal peptidase I [Aliamphritea spongicola]MBN3563187.1 signal peptidase I [Aliamphritea spongicola]